MTRAGLIATGCLVLVAGCSRPQQARLVARHGLPIAAGLHEATAATNRRMAAHHRTLDRRLDTLDIRRNEAMRLTAQAETLWRDTGRGKLLDHLAALRADDAAVRANPLATVSEPAQRASAFEPIDSAGLDGVTAALTRFQQGGRTGDFSDLVAFGRQLCETGHKLAAEQKVDVKFACEPKK